MKKTSFRFKTLLLIFFILLLLFVFRPYLFSSKVLFPSNLLMSSYAPWKFEPVPEYPNGPPNKPMGFDDIRQFFPNRKLLAESLAKGVIPLWNPYIYSGTPFMAAFDSAVWYPLSWIAALLPVIESWNFLVIIQPVLSLVFMYLFLRSMKFTPVTCAYGAFIWAFAGFMVVYWQEILVLEHSFLWLPLALYASNRMWENRNDRTGFILLIVSLASSVFGGFLQMSMYVYAVVLAWNLFLTISYRKFHLKLFSAIILSSVIACIQIIPSLEAFVMSPRGTSDGVTTFRNSLLPFWNLITLIAPDYWGNPATYNYFGGSGFYFEKMMFVGIIPLIFSFYAMAERKDKNILFWTVTAIVALSMGFVLPTSWIPNILHIPVLANSYPTRIFGIWAFAATVLSCIGVSAFIEKPDYRRLLYIVSGLTAILIAGWVVPLSAWCILHSYPAGAVWCIGKTSVLWDIVGNIPAIFQRKEFYAVVSIRNLVLPTIFVGVGWTLALVRKLPVRLTIGIIFVTALTSGLYFTQKYVQFSERRFVYPDLAVTREISSIAHFDRVWGYGDAYIEKNIPQYYSWFSTDGYGNLSPNRYAQLLATVASGGRLSGVTRRSDTDIYEASERDSMASNPYRLRMMSLLGVRYVLESKKIDFIGKKKTDERFPPSLFTSVWEDDSWRIWQFKQALPRVIFAGHVLIRNEDQQIVDALFDPAVDLGSTAVLEKDPGVVLPETPGATGSAHIISYSLNSVTIRSRSDSDGFVVLTDNYYPGWNVTVDGKHGVVERADYTFKAVFVPRGEHNIVFYYLPQSVIIGGGMSIAGIITSVIVVLFMKRKRVHS